MRRADGLGAAVVRRSSRSGSSPTTATASVDARRRRATEATIKVHVGGERVDRAPPRATARSTRSTPRCAPRSAARYPALERVHLTDYKVRVLDTAKGTGAVTRVLIDSTNGDRTWTTIGVSENIIEASWQALFDSIVYGLLAGRTATRSGASSRACAPRAD